MKKFILLLVISLFFSSTSFAQEHDDKWGAWYMYFLNSDFKNSKFGIQADTQYRDWQLAGDLQQYIIRGAITYAPIPDLKLAGGYSYFINGAEGESKINTNEHRLFQDVNLPQKLGNFMAINHRVRIEERWVEDQNFRSRIRYLLAMTIPLTRDENEKTKLYLAIFDEVFINGQKNIGGGRQVTLFDRNWLYGAFGYAFSEHFKLQIGALNQVTEADIKNNLLVSLIHTL